MKRSTHEPINRNPNQGKKAMPTTIQKQTTLNPNQGKNTMPSTTKKKQTTATIMAPPTSTAAPPASPLPDTSAITNAVSGNVPGKARVINGLVALLGALSANYAAGDTFELPSGTYTLPDIAQALNAYITAVSNVGSIGRAFHSAVENERNLRTSALALRGQLKVYIAARVGKTATAMATYGFVPAKIPTYSVKSKIAGAVKAEATRAARGTMGSKQKLAITGNVTSVTITPNTSQPAAPTQAAALTQATAPSLVSAVTQAAAPTQPAASALPAPVTTLPTKS